MRVTSWHVYGGNVMTRMGKHNVGEISLPVALAVRRLTMGPLSKAWDGVH